ncbi:MAG: hypothetical protein GX803_05840 [Lentisphaerae bacterium]|jgi:hypothetical protein|nr:hypothetical protein [Lentisphaerota bacterium]
MPKETACGHPAGAGRTAIWCGMILYGRSDASAMRPNLNSHEAASSKNSGAYFAETAPRFLQILSRAAMSCGQRTEGGGGQLRQPCKETACSHPAGAGWTAIRCGIFHGVEKFFPWRGKVDEKCCRSARGASLARPASAGRYRPRVRHASNKLDFGSALGYSMAWKGFGGETGGKEAKKGVLEAKMGQKRLKNGVFGGFGVFLGVG